MDQLQAIGILMKPTVNPKKINKSDYSIKDIGVEEIAEVANELLYKK